MKATRFYKPEEFEEIANKTLRDAELYPEKNRPKVKIDLLVEGYPGVELDQFADMNDTGLLGVTQLKGDGFMVSINSSLTRRYDSKHTLEWEQSLWRTTLAHELGHVILHHRELSEASLFRCTNNQIVRPAVRDYDQVEFQANALMAALLMPKELILDNYTDACIRIDHPREIIEDLALSFEVSWTAMSIRLKRLGLDPYDN